MIDEHVMVRFFLIGEHGRRHVGQIVLHHSDIWIVERMLEDADGACDVRAAVGTVPKPIEYVLKVVT